MDFKNKKISGLIILAIFVFSIGGAMAYDQAPFENESHASSGCHDGGGVGDGPTIESVNATIFKDSLYTEQGISIPNVTYTDGVLTLTMYIVNFTEAVNDSNGRRDPLGTGGVTVQISPLRGNNSDFTVLKGVYNNDDAKADANGYWHTNDEIPLSNETGDSLEPVTLLLTAPSKVGVYNLTIDVLDARNETGSTTIAVIYATASLNITVIARPPASSGGGGGDRDLYKEDTIPGNLLIITFFSIFAVSTILIIKRKKQLKRKT